MENFVLFSLEECHLFCVYIMSNACLSQDFNIFVHVSPTNFCKVLPVLT